MPGLFSGELIFGGAYNWSEFCVPKLVGLDNKNSYENSLKQLKTANPNSPWAYIREGLLSEGYLRLRFRGLIFGRAYFLLFLFICLFFIYLFIYFFFLGGGGGGGLIIGILRCLNKAHPEQFSKIHFVIRFHPSHR